MQSLSQHRSRRGETRGEQARTLLLGQSGTSTVGEQRHTRSSWAARVLITVPVEASPSPASLLSAQESRPETVARREVRRVFTLQRMRAVAVRVERS